MVHKEISKIIIAKVHNKKNKVKNKNKNYSWFKIFIVNHHWVIMKWTVIQNRIKVI